MAREILEEGKYNYDAITEGLIPINGENSNAIYGNNLNNIIWGSGYTDLIDGNNGNDSLVGRGDDDMILGGYGNDLLLGDSEDINATYITGNDLLFGDVGDDTLYGGPGNDKLYGGAGNDYYDYHFLRDSGIDTINDDNYATSQPGAGDLSNDDRLYIDVPFSSIQMYRNGENLLVTSTVHIAKGVIIEDFFLGGNNLIEYIFDSNGDHIDLSETLETFDDSFEENDTFETAYDITELKGQENLLIFNDLDFYQVTITNYELVTVNLFFDHNSVDLNLFIYDESENLLAYSLNQNDDEIIEIDLFAGTYFFLVSKAESEVNDFYSLVWDSRQIEDQFEYNNNIVNSTELSLINGEVSIAAVARDEDFYTFSLDSGNHAVEIVTEFTDDWGNLDLGLFDSNGQILATSESINDNEIINTTLTAGTYYVLVLPVEGISNLYTLSIESIGINSVPTLANPIDNQIIIEDESFNFTFSENTFTDADGDTLNYSATLSNSTDLPSWLSFNPITRTFSGTPTNDHVGTLEITVTATDPLSETVTDTFTITVENVNDAPTLDNPIPDQIINEDQSFNFTIGETTFNDIDVGDTLTHTAILADGNELPNWLNFDPATKTFSGTPSPENVGTLNLKVTATDTEGAMVEDTFILTVENSILEGTPNDDLIRGTSDQDVIDGREGNDKLYGNGGADTLLGGSDNDLLKGNSGDDILDGGKGHDRLFGNGGADQFILRSGEGQDTIFGYQDGQDSFLLAEGLTFGQLEITQNDKDTWLNLANSGELLTILKRVEVSLIGAEDFATIT